MNNLKNISIDSTFSKKNKMQYIGLLNQNDNKNIQKQLSNGENKKCMTNLITSVYPFINFKSDLCTKDLKLLFLGCR